MGFVPRPGTLSAVTLRRREQLLPRRASASRMMRRLTHPWTRKIYVGRNIWHAEQGTPSLGNLLLSARPSPAPTSHPFFLSPLPRRLLTVFSPADSSAIHAVLRLALYPLPATHQIHTSYPTLPLDDFRGTNTDLTDAEARIVAEGWIEPVEPSLKIELGGTEVQMQP